LTDKEAIDKYRDFVNSYPHLFPPGFPPEELEKNFNDHNKEIVEDAAYGLYGEVPAPFPTVLHQLKRISEVSAKETHLLLINGAANDLDFEELLNPEEHRETFVTHYGPILDEVCYVRVRSVLRAARMKFPRAVILYVGYFSPFFPGVADDALKKLFEHESREESWKVALNRKLHFISTGEFVVEAQNRAMYAAARGLHGQRKAVSVCSADPALAGPGIVFIHPRFGRENAAFTAESFFHEGYRLDSVQDAARRARDDGCPRRRHDQAMERLLIALRANLANVGATVSKEQIAELRATVDGPVKLLRALSALAEAPDDRSKMAQTVEALEKDLKRINHTRRASFLHPNEKGAKRYSDVIVERYMNRVRNVRLREDLSRLRLPNSSRTLSLRKSLRRYGVRSIGSTRVMSQSMLVDSVALEVVTAADSPETLSDYFFLNLGEGNRWQLNFSYVIMLSPDRRPVSSTEILHKSFQPGATDLFSFDACSVHLSSISQCVLECELNEYFPSKGAWKPASISLYLNGIKVLTAQCDKALGPGGSVQFPYPF